MTQQSDQNHVAAILKRLGLGTLLGFIFGTTLGMLLGLATEDLRIGLAIGSVAGITMGATVAWTGSITRSRATARLGRLALFFASALVLPCFSPSFYYHASKRKVAHGIAFMLAFGMLLASLKMLSFASAMQTVRRSVTDLFASARVPSITISEGYAKIDSQQPVVLADSQEMLIVLDGTGAYNGDELRAGHLNGGLIVSRDNLTLLNEQGETLIIPFSILKRWSWVDPRIDASVAARLVSLTYLILFAGWALWFTWIRLLYVGLLAALVRALSGLSGRHIDFSSLLVTGMFATVPATYLTHLFERMGGLLYGRFTLFLMLFWATGLVAVVLPRKEGDLLRGQRPLRPWRALTGLPLLLAMALESIFGWNDAPVILVGAGVVSMLLFLLVALLPQAGQSYLMRPGREVVQRA